MDPHEKLKYLRSVRYRAMSWLIAGLLVAAYFSKPYRLYILFGAFALSMAAMAPMFSLKEIKEEQRHAIDMKNPADRNRVLFILLFVMFMIAVSVITVLTRRH